MQKIDNLAPARVELKILLRTRVVWLLYDCDENVDKLSISKFDKRGQFVCVRLPR